MDGLKSVWRRFLGLFQSDSLEGEMSEEMQFHIDMEVQRNVEKGMSEKEARQAAKRQFGHMDTIKETAREERSVPVVENAFRDLKVAVRQLKKSPGFAFVVILTIALGIGMNTAMFSMLNGLLLRPLSFPEPEQLFRLDRNTPDQLHANHSADNFIDIKEASADFADLGGLIPWGSNLKLADGPAEIVSGARVTSNYFDVLQIKPLRGRLFRPDEALPGQGRVIAISDQYWQRRFGGREDVVGSVVLVDKEEVEIVAIMPTVTDVNRIITGIRFPEPFPFFRPISFTDYERNARLSGTVQAVGRLKPGVDFAQAQIRFDIIAGELADRFPTENGNVLLNLRPLQSTVLSGSNRTITFMLIGLSGFVLFIACGNLANLLLVRSMKRAREFSVCAALGASPVQLIRPIVAECLVLAGAGAVVSLFVATATSRWLAHRFVDEFIPVDFSLDGRVLAFACIMSLVTALFFGLAPAWWVSRASPNDALRNDTRSMSGSRSQRGFRELLIIGQFALVLLTGAGVFIRGIERLRHDDLGWNPASVVTAMLNLQDERYGWGPPRVNFHNTLRERLLTIPGVENATVSNEIPSVHSPTTYEYSIWAGNPQESGENTFVAYSSVVSPSYFDTIGTRLLRGRLFDDNDHSRSQGVTLINETMAERLFPEVDAIGQGIGYLTNGRMNWVQIVGIVEDTRPIEARSSDIGFQVYQPYAQRTWEYVLLSVRTATPEVAASLVEPIRQKVAELEGNVALRRVTTMSTLIKQQTRVWETINELLLLFAGLGLSLAALGVYGIVSRTVTQRTSEFGIRMALGAQARDILRLVLGGNLRTALIGAGVGVIVSMMLSRYLASELPVFAVGNGPVLLVAVGVLMLVAIVACLLPAWRATKVDPSEALRSE